MDRARVRSARRGLTIAASLAVGLSVAAGVHAATGGPADDAAGRSAITDAALAGRPAITDAALAGRSAIADAALAGPAARAAATRGSTASPGPSATPAPAAPPYGCAPNGPAGSQTIYGTFGDASVIGWTGNRQAVTACLGGSFFVTTGNGPGSGSTAAVSGTTYGYGIYNDSPTTWANAGGYLPALVTGFQRDGAKVAITNFGDQVTIGGHRYVAIYSRVSVTNPTGRALTLKIGRAHV